VAIKSLPPAVAADPGRLAALLREAKLLGALHHPNIAGIRGLEQHGGRRYLVLEKVDGTTLAERLRQRPLPLAEALDCGAQVAAALAAAHEWRIVHRDLKPGNVMRTADGLVKVLDFGLAMHVAQPLPLSADCEPAAAAPGARAGTPGYMSPEQVLGLPQDERTDLFALGALLYRCLTGAPAFPGASAYAVIAATLHVPPDAALLPAGTSEPVRALLARMLEKDPSRRLADAAEAAAVLARAAGAGVVATLARSRTPDASRLPGHATPLIGRRREIAEVLTLLERAPLVTLTGAGGCGKSRLATEAARVAAGRADPADAIAAGHRIDHVWLADVAAAGDGNAVVAAIAAAAGLRDASEAGLDAALAARIGPGSALLVLDNCDRALPACAATAERLLARRSGLRLVATCRERLGVCGEQVLRVPPLAVPDAEASPTADAVSAMESARLFAACAAALPGGFRITAANAGVIAAICRDLDGVPLAIELTAALLRHQQLEAIAAELRRRVEPERTTGRPQGASDVAVARPDPLRAAVGLGYDRLAADERRCLRALSVFAGGWNLESAAALCMPDADEFATLDVLSRLVDKSLVAIQRADRIEPRYRLLEPVRRFAAGQRDHERESAALESRHRDWFVAVAERAAPSLLRGTDQAHSLAALEADHANLLAALEACDAAPDGAPLALRLAGSLWLFWYIRGHFARGREALRRAIERADAAAPTPARAQALFAAGGLALFQGDFAEGRRLTAAALALGQALGDELGIARALTHLALCDSGEGRYAEARERIERAIASFRTLGDPRRLSAALNNRGVFKRQQGDHAAALPDHAEALELQRRAGDRDGMLVTLLNLGLAAARVERNDDAARHVDEALALVEDLRARRSGAAALEVAAEVLAGRGLADDGVRLLGAAAALRARLALAPDDGWRRMQSDLVQRLRPALGAERFEGLVAEGGEWSLEAAVREARLRLAPDRGTTT